ncbi:MAG: guanitoxin biosynthesis heme-dependent pre-guanitoxin N-hydroxylase GntA [Candidatus Dormibacteria bacterium]
MTAVRLPAPGDHLFSTYLTLEGNELVDPTGYGAVPGVARLAHDAFVGMVTSPAFACVGARAAVSRGSYRVGMFGDLGSPESGFRLAQGLHRFSSDPEREESDFFTYAAFFTGPVGMDEVGFEDALWRQLRMLHQHDDSDWDPAVSANPTDPDFSFSFAGHAYFIVGLHAASSRWSRRFAWPTLVFNPHAQFDDLRADGRMSRWQEVIRGADAELQGAPNPNLSDFGELPEARQYSGRRNSKDWKCPFHAEGT